jgi:hypothetical protein
MVSFFAGGLFGLWIGTVFGFNMTEQQKQEERFLPYCYNNDKMVIEALKQFCSQIYGGPVD